jgi:hypothetical protein
VKGGSRLLEQEWVVDSLEDQAAEHVAVKLERSVWLRRKGIKPGFAQFISIHHTRELTFSSS